MHSRSYIKEIAEFVRRKYPAYVSGDDDFSTLEGTHQALRMIIDRIVDDEQTLINVYHLPL